MIFSDETGIYLTPTVMRTWGAVGQTPIVTHQGPRKKASLIGGLACQSDGSNCDLLIHGYPEQSIDAPKAIHFLKAIGETVQGPVTLFWDNSTVHRSDLVREFVETNGDWLEIVRFPAYAPDLNPIEFLWSLWKGSFLAGFCNSSMEQVRNLVFQAHDVTVGDQQLLRSCLLGSGLFTESDFVT